MRVSPRRRRNILRGADRRAFFVARRHGEHYCSTCGTYRPPHQFTGDDPRTCDDCRGLRRCRRCRQDHAVVEFGEARNSIARDDICWSCHSYRPLTEPERAILEAFLSDDERDVAVARDHVTLGRDSSGRRVQLSTTTRNRHLYLLGDQSDGAATLMKQLVIQDMVAGYGCGVVDVRGDTALDILGLVPLARVPAVTYFAPATGHGPAFNPLALPYPPQVVADHIVDVFRMFFTAGWGPQLEQLLRFGLLTLLGDRRPHTFADLYTFYIAPAYRAAIAESSPSPRLRAFWQHELANVDANALDMLVNRLAAFLTPLSPAEHLLSTSENGLDFEAILDGRQIFIANLSSDVLGDEPARLLANLLIRGFVQAARAYAERGGDGRPDVFFYVPEFQSYATAGFDTLLPACAQARLSLTFAHGRNGDRPAGLQAAMLPSVGSVVAFQMSPENAARLSDDMRTRCWARASTSEPYEHEAVRRSAGAPVRDRVRELLANGRAFIGEDQLNYEGWHVDKLLAEVERVRSLTLPDDLVEIDWPSAADFTHLGPVSALARLDQPDRIIALTIDPPPSPDAHIRSRILERPHRREPAARGPFESKPTLAPNQGRNAPNLTRRRRWRRPSQPLQRPAR